MIGQPWIKWFVLFSLFPQICSKTSCVFFGKPLGLPTLFVVEDILLAPEDDLAAKMKIMRADHSENVALQSVERLELQISQLGAKLMRRHLRNMVYGWQMQVYIYIHININNYIYIYTHAPYMDPVWTDGRFSLAQLPMPVTWCIK